jgi:hypothetical protein
MNRASRRLVGASVDRVGDAAPTEGGEVGCELVVVGLESLRPAERVGEHERAREPRRLPSARSQPLGERLVRLAENDTVADHAVRDRVEPGEERGVAHRGRRRRRVRLVERDAVGRECRQMWGRLARVPVEGAMVAPRRVERHEQHVRRPARAGPARGEQRRENDRSHPESHAAVMTSHG